MINIAIIDDEKAIHEKVVDTVRSLLSHIAAEIFVYSDGKTFVADVKEGKQFHVVISDTEVHGIGGIELGRHLKAVLPKTYLIYLTSSKEHAVDSYVLGAYQYVLKDELETRFAKVLQDLFHEIACADTAYLVVGNTSEQYKVRYEDIICIQKVKGTKYVDYVLADTTLRDRKTLAYLMEEAKNHNFVMLEKGHAVNMKYVTSFVGNLVTLSNGFDLIVSRTRIQEVRAALNAYWGID